MEQYIPKSTLVAEIKELQSKLNLDSPFGIGAYTNLSTLLDRVDNLEVKEVDLEKEIKRFTMSKELYESDSVIKAVAEHFFELGLKAQKGE